MFGSIAPLYGCWTTRLLQHYQPCTVIRSATSMFMVCNNCTMIFSSFTTSDSAMYSASVLDSTTLFIPLLRQGNGIPQKYMMYPKTLILVSLSLAKSLSLRAFSAHLMISFLTQI